MRNKGVVVEIAPKGKVIIMTAGGKFVEIPFKKHVHVGQEVRYSPRKKRLNVWQLGLTAILFLALVSSWPLLIEKLIPTEVAFVLTLDLNPSLELQISVEQRILAVEGLNRDGKDFLAHLDIIGQKLRPALEQITAQGKKLGYLKQGRDHVFLTIASPNGEEAIVQLEKGSSGKYSELVQTIYEVFSSTYLAQVKVWQVPGKLQTEAKLAGITPGRYVVIQAPVRRIETKLTMHDVEPIQRASANSIGQKSLPQWGSLKPTERDQQTSLAAIRVSGVYNVSLGVGSGKGDFRFYE